MENHRANIDMENTTVNTTKRLFRVEAAECEPATIEADDAFEAWKAYREANKLPEHYLFLPRSMGEAVIYRRGRVLGTVDELYVPEESDATGLAGFASELATGTRDAIQIDGEFIGCLFQISPVVRVYEPRTAA